MENNQFITYLKEAVKDSPYQWRVVNLSLLIMSELEKQGKSRKALADRVDIDLAELNSYLRLKEPYTLSLISRIEDFLGVKLIHIVDQNPVK